MTIEQRISDYTILLFFGLHILIWTLLPHVLTGVMVSSLIIMVSTIGLIGEIYGIKKNDEILDWSDQIIFHTIFITGGAGFFFLIIFMTNDVLLSLNLSNCYLSPGIFFLILGVRDKKRKSEIAHKRTIRRIKQTQNHLKKYDSDFKRIKDIPQKISDKKLEIEKINNKGLHLEMIHREEKHIMREIKLLNKELSSLEKKYRLKVHY
ncbi:MAG: hypothetical protein ACFFA3_18500 [Promethearchaeota archaeon]